MTPLAPPDPAPITRHLRAMYTSRLLLVAIHYIPVFETLRERPLTLFDLRQRLHLNERPAMVLIPALCAMGLLAYDSANCLYTTALGRYITQRNLPDLTGYTGLEKEDAGVIQLAHLLQNDGPADTHGGLAYVKDESAPSPMDDPALARSLTLGLAGRARHLSPLVAAALPESEGHLLDVAGGTGYYTYEWLLRNPAATATVFDRPAVLTVAAELLDAFGRSRHRGADTVRDRVTFLPGDMLTDNLPQADLLLAASLFHDWPAPTCMQLTGRFSNALRPGGELWVHDSFLNDTLDGPLAITDYSAQLFCITRGRAYSRAEYRSWFTQAGLVPDQRTIATQMDYSLICARKPLDR